MTKKLTYKNPTDDIPGRFLYDQEDVTDDYQVHAIYVLASDSKDKQYDVKGVIERIVLKGNKHFKNKTKEIAIIRTLGLSKKSIIKSFFLTGFTIGFLATISGKTFSTS